MPVVLVVDDVRNLAEQYAYDLKRIGGYVTRVATSGKEALDVLMADAVDCVILDLEMPGMDGFEVLRRIKKDGFHVPVIVYTGTGNYERCAQAIKLGAFSFIDKAESMERVANEVANAIEYSRVRPEVKRASPAFESPITGHSEPIRVLTAQLARLAAISSPVLILGESGSGKERVAQSLHAQGRRAKQSFVALNSSALPEALLEAIFFGHERGAFTGAHQMRRGAFEVASGGTLFLDEIGEMALSSQAKLLRAIEQGEITRVGAEKSIKVDVRLIAATHQDLAAQVAAKTFREDLYYRLHVHVVRVPPLRERASDIPELANELLTEICMRHGTERKRFDPAVIEVLMGYQWLGNVRELRSAIERMVIATDENVLGVDTIPDDVGSATPSVRPKARTFRQRKSEAERQIVVAALERNEWNITRTAADLELADHASLLKVMRRLGIKPR